jgi:hypothetical protein
LGAGNPPMAALTAAICPRKQATEKIGPKATSDKVVSAQVNGVTP